MKNNWAVRTLPGQPPGDVSGYSTDHFFGRRAIKKSATMLVALLIGLSLLIPAAEYSYGEGFSYFRDNQIIIELPETWESSEVDASEDSDGNSEQIFVAREKDGSPELFVVYIPIETDTYLYLNGEDQVREEYENTGKQYLTDFYSDLEGFELVSVGEPEYFDGEFIDYCVMAVTVKNDYDEDGTAETLEELVYWTASEQTVHKLLIFASNDPNQPASSLASTAEPIVDSFYDFGYDEALMGTEHSYVDSYDEYDYGDNSDEVSDTVMVICGYLLPLGGLILALYLGYRAKYRKDRGESPLRKMLGKRNFRKPNGSNGWLDVGSSVTEGLDSVQNLFRRKISKNREQSPRQNQSRSQVEAPTLAGNKMTAGRVGSEKTRVKHAAPVRQNAPMRQTGPARQTAMESYTRSLETLVNSGLITRQEMNEMIAKHQRR